MSEQDTTDELDRQQFIDEMHDYYGVEDGNELTVWADMYDSVIKSFITQKVTEARINEIEFLEINPLNREKIITFVEKFSGEALENRLTQLNMKAGK